MNHGSLRGIVSLLFLWCWSVLVPVLGAAQDAPLAGASSVSALPEGTYLFETLETSAVVTVTKDECRIAVNQSLLFHYSFADGVVQVTDFNLLSVPGASAQEKHPAKADFEIVAHGRSYDFLSAGYRQRIENIKMVEEATMAFSKGKGTSLRRENLTRISESSMMILMTTPAFRLTPTEPPPASPPSEIAP